MSFVVLRIYTPSDAYTANYAVLVIDHITSYCLQLRQMKERVGRLLSRHCSRYRQNCSIYSLRIIETVQACDRRATATRLVDRVVTECELHVCHGNHDFPHVRPPCKSALTGENSYTTLSFIMHPSDKKSSFALPR